MRLVGSSFVLGLALFTAACTSEDSGEKDPNQGAETGATAAQSSALTTSSEVMTSVNQAVAVADALFDVDRLDYDRAGDRTGDQDRATTLARDAKTGDGGCTKISVSGSTLNVDFGSGCTLTPNVTAAGAFALTIATASDALIGTGTSVSVVFTKLVVNGVDLDGSIAFARKDSTFNLTIASLTSKGNVLDGTLALTSSSTKRVLDGPISYTKGGGKSALDWQAVGMVKGACYPSEGTLGVASPNLDGIVTFTSQTPTTGVVQVKIGNAPAIPMTLPAYGSCPK